MLARRWALPKSIASVIERHHAEAATGEAALVRLADMHAHDVLGGSIPPSELLTVARTVGLTPASLRKVMYELPLPASGERPRQVEPCPMSTREVDVLRRLARGMVYKQIANELGLSDEHDPYPPAQRVRQAGCHGPRTGGPDRHRTRLDSILQCGRRRGSAGAFVDA